MLGISTDSLETHERWLATPPSQGGLGSLQFPLASDPEGMACQAYGVYLAKQRMALRGLFIIDPNGVLQYQIVHNLSVGRGTDEILRVLDGLQTGGMCPGDWTPEQAPINPSRDLVPNNVIGQYRIEVMLGRGGFGTVFRARDLTLERPVALKVLHPDGPTSPESLLTEARAAAALNHPNVCIVHAVDSSNGVPMIVMEYVDGQPLSKLLDRTPPERAASLGRQIALGMAVAHERRIVHGDLKPANIMVTSTGTIKIMDFGLARQLKPSTGITDTLRTNASQTSQSGTISGTPTYMAPELLRGERATMASDVFAFGLILYEIATGRPAVANGMLMAVMRRIENLDPEQLAADTPEPFAGILRRSLVNDPGRRTITMAEIAALLA